MAYPIPTLADLVAAHLARLESSLGQTSPINDKAFLNVLAATEGAEDIGLYKYAADRSRANLALTATGDDLDAIGQNEGIIRKVSVACVVVATIPATDGTIIPVNTVFIADANGSIYRTMEENIPSDDIASLNLQCSVSGSNGTLQVGDTLQISSQISGAETVATVLSITQTGVDTETDDDYRPRILFAQRAITGGGNAADYKTWAETVFGVKRVFPYSGRPVGAGTAYPGDRAVYVECTTDINLDGIAPSDILDDVRAAIETDPDTGYARPALGITDATLWVEAIIRTSGNVAILGLVVDTDNETACKASISDAISNYFLNIKPYVAGIDLVTQKNNTVTAVSIGNIVQDVLSSFGAFAETVTFYTSGSPIAAYTLGDGELMKLGAIVYVEP